MLLVIDIGNTNIVFGVYHEGKLINHWRLSTAMTKTVDEYAILLNSLLYIEKIRLNEIHSAIVSCVVPPLLIPFEIVCRKYIGIMPIVVEPGIKTGTTFDYITPKGEYAGGSIAPGILISLDALFERASKLPRVELVQPKTLIAKNTVQAMQAGITYGYVSLVDGIIKRMKQEVRTDPLVIATGGLSSLIYKGSDTIDVVDEFLTLEGLRILYEKNKDHHKFK
jgi:type III pantothenate kinase